jgi:mono/diheme cytochrome c family protein
MFNFRKLLPAIALLAGCGAAQAQSSSMAAPAVDTSAGQALFLQNCAACHLATGAGGVHFGNAVSADLRAPELETTYHNNDALILRAILQAKDEDGEPLDPPMPAWAGRLSQTQAGQILAYLHKLHS